MGIAMYLILGKLWKPTTRHRFVVLTTIFILYILIGAYVFSLLNYPQEKLEINELIMFKNQFYLNNTCLQRDRDRLEDLLSLVINLNNKGVYHYDLQTDANRTNDTNSSSSYTPKWKFGGNTIFFTYTLLATIGYGHLAPYTTYGKLFCTFYIVFGVPMTFLLLTALTERLVLFIERKFLKRKTLKTFDTSQSTPTTTTTNYATFDGRKADDSDVEGNEKKFPKVILYLKFALMLILFFVLIYILPAFILSKYTEERWSYLEAIYYCFISLTTIGLGDYVPGNYVSEDEQDIYRFAMTFYLLIGIISTAVVTNLLTRVTLIGTVTHSFSIKPNNNNNLNISNVSSTDSSEVNNTQ